MQQTLKIIFFQKKLNENSEHGRFISSVCEVEIFVCVFSSVLQRTTYLQY